MSTAVALQDMSPDAREQNSNIRHRVIPKPNVENNPSTATQDDWLDTPHDVDSTPVPLDSPSFNPTNTYWISPHGLLTKQITILDLTKDISIPYTGLTSTYKAEVQKTLKDHAFTPALTCHRNHWLGLKYSITDEQDTTIAEWKHPWSSVGEAVLTFPEDPPHCSHPVTLRNKRWGSRTEGFTVESQPFFWEMDSLWHSTNMTLYRVFGSGESEKKIVVAKYAQEWWGGFVTGGTVVVDERELDGCLACLTLCVVLKKKRQRAAERHNGGE